MYHRVKISEASHDYLRLFALIRDPETGQIKIELYWSKTLVFGLNCTPYIAQWIVRTTVRNSLPKWLLICSFVRLTPIVEHERKGCVSLSYWNQGQISSFSKDP